MSPKISYRIWFAPRTGSTLLCKGLESTGVAGKPGETFNIYEPENLCSTYKAATYEELKENIWKTFSTDNGVFGVKNSMFRSRQEIMLNEILKLRNIEKTPDFNEEEIWDDLFPNCKHIILTRRNKIRQAVSWWKAIKDEKWHLQDETLNTTNEDFYKSNYDKDALNHLLTETVLHECLFEDYFSKNNIQPLTIIYEDYIKDFEGSIKKIINFLGIDVSQVEVGTKYYQRTANEYSEEWVQKYRFDLQAKWDKKVW